MKKASATLQRIDTDSLPNVCALEYLTAAALLALAEDKRDQLRRIAAQLRSLPIHELYFRSQRDQVCPEVYEWLLGKSKEADSDRVSKKIFDVLARLRGVAQYLELKPNLFGVGVNLNRIIVAPKEHPTEDE